MSDRNKTRIEVIRKVWDDFDGYLTVGVAPDDPDCVGLYTQNEKMDEYFGKINLLLAPEFARNLARALIHCADEIDGEI